jgi:hypothetical protein
MAHLDLWGADMTRLDDINRPYVPAAKTDIYKTFILHGWVPPSQHAWYQEKWANYRHLLAINEGVKK